MRTLFLYLPALVCAALMFLCMRKGHGSHDAGCQHHKGDETRAHAHDAGRERDHGAEPDATREHGAPLKRSLR